MLVAVVSTIAGVLVAAILAFFAWLAISIMNLRAGQLALEEGQKKIVAELRGEFTVALARMETQLMASETRLMAAIYGRNPQPPEIAFDESDD